MKSVAVILGAAVCLLLIVTESQGNDEEHAIVEEQMLEDLAELLKVKKEEGLQVEQPQMDDYPKPKSGQIILPCSYYKYGCCQDGKTKAKGPNKKGCGEKLCVDNSVGYCRKNRDKLNCRRGSSDYERCTYTCDACPKKPASRLQVCMKERTPFGCCWNGDRALTPNKRDCPPCRDLTAHICRQFRYISGGCLSGSYGIRTFMQKYCPRTCGLCYLSRK